MARIVFEHNKAGLVHTAFVHSDETAHAQRLYLLFVENGAVNTCFSGTLLQLRGERFGIEVGHRCVDPFATLADAIPEGDEGFQLVGTEERLVDGQLLDVDGLFGFITVESIVGKEQTFGKGYHLFGYHSFAGEGHLGLLSIAEHINHFGGAAAQAFLALVGIEFAVEIDDKKLVWEAVEYDDSIGFIDTAGLQVVQFLFAEGQ